MYGPDDFLACLLRHCFGNNSDELIGWPVENVLPMVVRVKNHPFLRLHLGKFSLVRTPMALLHGLSLSENPA